MQRKHLISSQVFVKPAEHHLMCCFCFCHFLMVVHVIFNCPAMLYIWEDFKKCVNLHKGEKALHGFKKLPVTYAWETKCLFWFFPLQTQMHLNDQSSREREETWVCADKISACLSTPSDGAASTAICALTSAGELQVKFRTHIVIYNGA